MASPDKLTTVIRNAWNEETTSIPDEWNADTNPARGQCVPSALVVQDHMGGQIMRVMTYVDGHRETHYRNILPDGSVMDVSGDQYPKTQVFSVAPVVGSAEYTTLRDYMLSYPATRHRYELLAAAVNDLLALESE
jgi:hypothetical protein